MSSTNSPLSIRVKQNILLASEPSHIKTSAPIPIPTTNSFGKTNVFPTRLMIPQPIVSVTKDQVPVTTVNSLSTPASESKSIPDNTQITSILPVTQMIDPVSLLLSTRIETMTNSDLSDVDITFIRKISAMGDLKQKISHLEIETKLQHENSQLKAQLDALKNEKSQEICYLHAKIRRLESENKQLRLEVSSQYKDAQEESSLMWDAVSAIEEYTLIPSNR